MMRNLVIAAAAGCAHAHWQESGNLIGVYSSTDDGSCSLWSVSPSTGANVTMGKTGVCDDVAPQWPTFSALSSDSRSLYFALSSAPTLYSVDIATGKTGGLAPFAYNTSDPFLGLVTVGTTPYVVTQYNVYALSAGTLSNVLSYTSGFPAEAQVAAAPTGGSGAGQLFVHDEGSDLLTVVDLATFKVTTAHTKISSMLAMVYDDGSVTGKNPRLVVVQGYTLLDYDLSTKRKATIGSIPDGPGYPRDVALSPSGKTLAIIDFANIFTLDTVTGAVGPNFPFDLAPRRVGLPMWIA